MRYWYSFTPDSKSQADSFASYLQRNRIIYRRSKTEVHFLLDGQQQIRKVGSWLAENASARTLD